MPTIRIKVGLERSLRQRKLRYMAHTRQGVYD
jgi:hypothetical protein